jgi:hypothetical protein
VWGCVAACGGTTAKPAAVDNRADVVARDSAAPRIAWVASENRFVGTGLPAAAREGMVAVVAVSGGDGARGYPNVHVEVRDRDDGLVQTIAVVAANDWEQLAPDGKPGPQLDHHIADVNHELARIHGHYDLVPLAELKVMDDDLALGDGLFVGWNGDRIDIVRKPAADARDQRLARRDTSAWRAPKASCEHPAYLGGAYHVDPINLVVVDVRYRGTDTCWEPPDQWHVVAW